MSHFFAYLSRMKLIERWALMHNIRRENVQEHSLQVAIVAHALAVLKNKFFNGDVNPERVALLAVFHDASEVLTGDLPTPVKYFNPDIKAAYRSIEAHANKKLLSFLPEVLHEEYKDILVGDEDEKEHWKLVKAADGLCAYIKCVEEGAAGNGEFNRAKATIELSLKEMELPEVDYFLRNFMPSFSLTLDELSV